ncbi:hypothetical protein TMU01_10270 [Tenuibacillus multivorans]|nr:hypothetical protein TMU01_10270 [Tenuibacillus multivorans]
MILRILKENLKYASKNNLKLVSKLHSIISNGNRQGDEFEYIKDAGMYVCPAGHMAIRKSKQGKKRSKQEPDYNLLF